MGSTEDVPSAPRRPHPLEAHGRTRIDDWYWLRDGEDPQVIAYLEAENRYCASVLAPTEKAQEVLFEQIKARVRQTDAGPPARHGDWWYFSRTEEGRQYPITCRLADPGRTLAAAEVAGRARAGRLTGEQTVLDENELAAGGGYLAVGVLDVSPDHAVMAYAVDHDGSEEYTLRFRALPSGPELVDTIPGVYYGSAWSSGGTHFFYVRPDQAMRPWQVWCHEIGTDPAGDRLIWQEDDERFFVHVELSRSEERVVVVSASKTTSEVRWLDAGDPTREPRVLLHRRPGVEYHAEHDGGSSWLVLTNAPSGDQPATNFALYRHDEGGGSQLLIPARDDVKLESVDSFAGFFVVVERSATDGLERLRVVERSGRDRVIEQPEPAYTLIGGTNPDWDQSSYRFGYTSLVTPRQSVDYRVETQERDTVWSQEVPGYEPQRYRTERLWATAPDGVAVPLTIVCRADVASDSTAAGLLYGYGAYEHPSEPVFSAANLNLVERGVVYAIAHVRGGGELGRRWYEGGRMENKRNSFTDFVAAAERLVDGGWVAAGRLVARGASAGGLLMGAVTNMRPDLWRAVVAEVPFVDVVTTMCDVSLPLTVTEWEEWGDPLHDEAAFDRMLAYSPYDNVAENPVWPALFVTAGLNDPRVGFWEPAKWVAKLRSVGAGRAGRPLVLRTEMGAGHQGSSGRYDAWRDEARVQAFLLDQLGVIGAG